MSKGSLAALGEKLQQQLQTDNEQLEQLRSSMLAAHRKALDDAQDQISKQLSGHVDSLSKLSSDGARSINDATALTVQALEFGRAKLSRTVNWLTWLQLSTSLVLLVLSVCLTGVTLSTLRELRVALDERAEQIQKREQRLAAAEQKLREALGSLRRK